MNSAVRIENLRKAYGSVVAVEGVSFDVPAGEIFGVVGPNGAGKTTTIECIEGIRRADRGSILVLGLDPARQERELRQRIGVQLQQSALPARIKVWEALDLYASFYDQAVDGRALLDRLGLADKRNAAFAKLSGGQKQRLFIALALLIFRSLSSPKSKSIAAASYSVPQVPPAGTKTAFLVCSSSTVIAFPLRRTW